MKLTFAIFVACALLSACATDTPAPQAEHDRTCAVLAAVPAPNQDQRLSDAERTLLRSITPQRLAPPSYQCGATSFQTDPSQRGVTYTAVGFTADGQHAALSLQSVAGPLAGAGFNCLLDRNGEAWRLRSCENTWIS